MEIPGPSEAAEVQLRSRIAELEDALSATEARLREVDHRARNDLQLVWSILLMQTRRLPEGPARKALRRAADRVAALAAALKHLPHPADPSRLDAQALLRELVGEIAAGAGRPDVRLQLDLDPVRVTPAQAAPLGLIVEELVHNALGHAFPERGGQIEISLQETDGGAALTISDDGVGADLATCRSGFGIGLVELLCKQLRAELALAPGAPGGLRAAVRIPGAS